MNEFLTISEAGRILKLSRPTIYRLFKRGLKFYKIGRSVRIKREDLERFIEGKPKLKTSRMKGRKKSK